MEPTQQLAQLEQKVDAIYASVEKTRKYFMWTLITTLVVFFLPLMALMFVAPQFINTYTEQINALTQ
jgi:hypothetical protein